MKQAIILLTIFGISGGLVYGQTSKPKADKKTGKNKTAKQFIKPADVFPGKGYSHAISVSSGRTIYVAGQIALNQKGELVGKDDLQAQTQQVFENIRAVLAASGATFADVVKLNYYVKNFKPEALPAIREVRDAFLAKDQPPPTSTLVGVETLFRDDVLIEIDCIAVIDR